MYIVLEQPIVPRTYILNFIGNQFPTTIQLVTSKDRQLVQQLVTTSMPTTIQVTTSLPTYVPICSNHQPPYRKQFGDSLGRSSTEGDLLRKPPFNPIVASFGWHT